MAIEVNAADVLQFRVFGGFPEDDGLLTKTGFENRTGSLRRDLWVV